MQYPRGQCDRCGERLYARIDGAYQCHNCGARYLDESGSVEKIFEE